MANIFTYTFFIIGLFLIIKGGDIFVDSATQAAKMLKIPNFIIGATIVSIATTLPEIIVSVQATVTKNVENKHYNLKAKAKNIIFCLH